jgi:hypothetical protein
MVAPEDEVPEAVLRSPPYLSPGVSASDQRLATGRKLAAARVKIKPIPQQQIGWGSGTAATPDPDVHREFVSMAPAPQVET